jgi:type II secretory pathway component PulK
VQEVSGHREHGVVLILVLVIIVLTVSSVYAFARTSVLDVLGSRQRMDRVRSQLLARSGVALARQALADDLEAPEEWLERQLETPRDAWALVAREPIRMNGGGEIVLHIQDLGSRINLNGLVDAEGKEHSESRAFLLAALTHVIEEMPGRKEEKIYDVEALADAILDWLDTDETARLGDDEAERYGKPGAAATPVNRPLFSLAELSEVPGADGRLLHALSHYFVTQPLFVPLESAGVNPNTAAPHVLGLIFHGGPADEKRLLAEHADDLGRLLRLREEGAIFCEGPQSGDAGQAAASAKRGAKKASAKRPAQSERCTPVAPEVLPLGDGIFPPLQYTSSIFRIESEGRYDNARARVVTVVDRSGEGGAEGLETLYYRMD